MRRVGHDEVLSAVPPPTADALLDALSAFEPGMVLVRDQPAQQQTRAAIGRPR